VSVPDVESIEREIEAGGFRTHYIEAGNGPTVLLIHGSGPGVSAYANWRFLIPVLAEHFRVLAPDVIGFGKSERLEHGTYDTGLWVDHLIAFLEATGTERCSIVGNSMGGALAIALAIKRPDLVHRLVLMGTTGLSFPITAGLEAVWGYEPSEAAMRELIATHFAFNQAIATDELVRLRYEASIIPGYHESYHAMFPAPRQAGVERLASDPEKIAELTMPVLLVHGREDRVIPLAVSQRLLEIIPNADLHVFSHCGHWTQIERKDAFNELTAGFLRD